jgi:hypothetical protein
MDLFDYINQSRVWLPKSGDPIDIRDMTLIWRRNAAMWMIRKSSELYMEYRLAEIVDAIDRRISGKETGSIKDLLPTFVTVIQDSDKPDEWIMTTNLYNALCEDLPRDPRDVFYWRNIHGTEQTA